MIGGATMVEGVGWLGLRWQRNGVTRTRVCKWAGGVGEVGGRGMR